MNVTLLKWSPLITFDGFRDPFYVSLFSKQIWVVPPLIILPKFSAISPFGFSVTTDPPILSLPEIKRSPSKILRATSQPPPPPSPAINNDRSVRWIIKSRLSLILRVNVVLNRTVVVHGDSLSSAEASLFYGEAFVLWGGWGESKRERAGHDRLCIFFDYWYFDGDTQREPLRRRETVTDVFSTCVVVIFRVCLLIWLVNYVATNTINWRYTTHFDPDDDYRTGCQNASHCQQQCNSPVTTRFTRTIKQWLLGANLLQGRFDIMQIRANSILGSL